ncbi:hypothetical protein QEJ31_10335 [Pigmentibacter sp. JX0631]|uniref:hypothetical protein n=1 Tax=Pigmentibacter sp. JX0631 TaxID=2976982 RepID=UPI002469B56A|nr:hypothetical protein [Pigmentibacter sp. JX0631]WGL58920.1 hypothetical protein QEJ31_10335 [Pigmentibacter sp. JX0631]
MKVLHFIQLWILFILIIGCKNINGDSSMQNESPSIIQKNYSESIKQYENENISQDNNIYVTYKNIAAEKKANFQSDKNDVYIKNDQLVIDNFVIYKKEKESEDSGSVKKNDNFDVVYNKTSGNFAIITNNIIVKIQPSKKLILPNSTNYKIKKSFKKIGVYIIQIPSNIDISKVKNELEKANHIAEGSDSKVIIETIELVKVNKPA